MGKKRTKKRQAVINANHQNPSANKKIEQFGVNKTKTTLLEQPFVKEILSLFLLLSAILFVYSNTFNASFHLDDRSNITENKQIRNISNLPEVIRGTDRPVAMFVNALNYHFGKLDVRGYHYVNITIHILTAFVLYFILLNTFVFSSVIASEAKQSHTFSLPNLSAKYADKKYSLALIASLIFAIHPIQTQAITYIIQGRMAGLATLFYLATLLFFILGTKAQRVVSGQWSVVSFLPIPHSSLPHSLTTMSHSNSTATLSLHHFIASSLFYLLAILSSALGMGTKQIAITAPVMILIYDYFFIANGNLRELKKRLPVHIGLFLTIGIAVYFTIIGIKHATGVGFAIKEFTPFQYLFNQFKIVLYYVFLLLFPVNLNLDYDWHISHSFFEPLTLICFILLVLLLAAGVKIYRKHKLLCFCILWFLITLTPESTIIPIEDVIFEHRVYLPSTFFVLFFVLLLSEGLEFLKSKFSKNAGAYYKLFRLSGYLIVLCCAISFSILTYSRNAVWKEETTLWEDCVKKSPNKPRTYNNLGVVYLETRQYDKAITVLKKAIKLDPMAPRPYTSLGIAYTRVGQYDKAIAVLGKAIKLDPTNFQPYNNLGVIYGDTGQPDKAILFLGKAIELKPTYADAYSNLATNYGKVGKLEDAFSALQKSLKLDPTNSNAYSNLGICYRKMKKPYMAIKSFEEAIRLNSSAMDAYNGLGNAYADIGEYEKAITIYKKAIAVAPYYIRAYGNLGFTYEYIGKDELALEVYNQMMKIMPTSSIGYIKMGLLYKKLHNNHQSIYYLTKALNYIPSQDIEKIQEISEQIKSLQP